MNDEAAVCATAFFRTIGRDVTTPDDFVMRTSLEMKWLPPSDAKVLLAYLMDEGAVIRKDSYIRPSPDLEDVEVPLAYKPSKSLMDAMRAPRPAVMETPVAKGVEPAQCEKDVFHVLMDAAVENGLARRDFIQNCNRIQKRLGIDIGAAALIVLRDGGVDITPYVEMVYREASVTPS